MSTGTSQIYVAGEGAIFIQLDGPNTKPDYLGCHLMGDVGEPGGDVTLYYCPDKSQPSKFKVVGRTQAAPGPVTTTITTYVKKTLDYLEKIDTEKQVGLFIHKRKSGVADDFNSWERSFILPNVTRTNTTLTGLAARQPDDNTNNDMAMDFSADFLIRAIELGVARQSTVGVTAANDMSFYTDLLGYYATDAGAGVTAEVLRTADGGTTIAATAADPFAIDEDILGITTFQVGTSERVLCVREFDAANPMEVAYSDDSGATWNLVVVGAVNGQGGTVGGCLFALDSSNIWLCTNDGYIYKSEDAGESWTAQESGVIAATALNHIHFCDENYGMCVGAADVVEVTSDGGATWQAGTATGGGDDLYSCFRKNENDGWLGADINAGASTLWYTDDGAVTWSSRTGWTGSSAGQVNDIIFINDYEGFLISDTAAPVGSLWRTVDGGYNWELAEDNFPTNSGVNALDDAPLNIPDALLYMCGEANGGTSFIAKGSNA